MIDDLNWKRLNICDWGYIQELFPYAYEEIDSWYLHLYERELISYENVEQIWLDEYLFFDFFDGLKIHVCVIPSLEEGWNLNIYLDKSLEFEKDFFPTRSHAEEYGFIWATWHLEQKFKLLGDADDN